MNSYHHPYFMWLVQGIIFTIGVDFYVDGGSFRWQGLLSFQMVNFHRFAGLCCQSRRTPKSSKMGHFCGCSNKLSLLSFQNGAWKCVVKGSPENRIRWSDQLRVLRKLHGLERCGPLSPVLNDIDRHTIYQSINALRRKTSRLTEW